MSKRRNLKYRYLKTKEALGKTIQMLLDINRRRARPTPEQDPDALAEELKILNATAKNQARALKTYELKLAELQDSTAA